MPAPPPALAGASRLWTLWLGLGAAIGVAVSSYLLLDRTLREANPDTPIGKAAAAATDAVLPGEPVTLLLIGSDKRPGRQGRGDTGRSDSLILVRMDSTRGFISMLSFPRDLYVPIPGHGTDKINAAYSDGGPAKTIQTIRALTGQRINYYLNVDFQGFARLVNQVGGVYVDVDRRYFNDNSDPGPEGTYAAIDLKPGYQRLDGADALAYVRYRHTDSDFARIARQQQFLSELKRQTGRFSNLLDLSTFAHLFSDNVRDQPELGQPPAVAGPAGLHHGQGPGGPGRDRRGRRPCATRRRWSSPPRPRSGRRSPRGATRPSRPARRPGAVDPATVSIGVLNGNGRLLGAESAVDALRAHRYDATAEGNADNFRYGASAVFYAPGQRDGGQGRPVPPGARARASPRPRAARPAAGTWPVVAGRPSAGGRRPGADRPGGRRVGARTSSGPAAWPASSRRSSGSPG